MEKRTLFVALSCVVGTSLVVLWLAAAPAHGSPSPERIGGLTEKAIASPRADAYVCPVGCQHRSLQVAIDAVAPGATIKVGQGIYTDVHAREGITQVAFITKSLNILGGYSPADWSADDPAAHPTTLDAGGQGRVFYVSGDVEVTLQGLRITGGNATGLPPGVVPGRGGGVYVYGATATISDCKVFSNTASTDTGGYGGGLYLEQSEVTLRGSIISENSAAYGYTGRGGGLYAYGCQLELVGNTVTSNTASAQGGGISVVWSAADVRSNAISGNATTESGSGAGLYLSYVDLDLTANRISRNTSAWSGGGLMVDGGDAFHLVNNAVIDNEARVFGGGIYLQGASARLSHTTLARNAGGDGAAVTLSGDTHGTASTITATNSVIVSHTVGVTSYGGCSATLQATLWHGNQTDWGGEVSVMENHYGDPAFVEDGYHIAWNSAAIDRGVDDGVRVDIDGMHRPWTLGFDLGADEFPLTMVYMPRSTRPPSP
jgi:hypothetical protein